MKKTLLAAALFGATLATTAAQAATPDELRQADKVRIGVFADKPPFGYLDSKGEPQGFDVEIGKAIGADLLGDASKVEFVPVEAANRVAFLESGKVDIILANFTNTPERAEVVDFAHPYMKVDLGVVSPKDAPITSVDQLKGQTLLVNQGTTADQFFRKNHHDANLLKFEQNTETFNALLDGRGVALAHDNTLVLAWAKEHPDFTVGIAKLGDESVIAPAVQKGDDELRAYLDAQIDQFNQDRTIAAAYEKTLEPVFGADAKGDILISE